MATASARTIGALAAIVESTGVGSNVALLHLLWAMVSGRFLESRGAVYPALKGAGFSDEQTRRAGQALRRGVWSISGLIENFRALVAREQRWQPTSYEGYQPVAADVTVFWRPRLQGRVGKFFHRLAGRAMQGVGVGIVVQVGAVGTQRLPIVKQLVAPPAEARSDQGLQSHLLRQAAAQLGPQDVLVYDAGASLAEVQAAQAQRYVVRLARNCTARRSQLPEPTSAKGRPRQYGELVRPLARRHKQRELPATPPDETTTFEVQGRTIQAHGWHKLVRANQKVAEQEATFSIWCFHDPLYPQPLIVGTNIVASAATIFHCYCDRWPVEQIPLVAKQLLGLQRHFVFAPSSCERLPQLALLAGNLLSYLAAVMPPLASGFWDRHPAATPGRLRRRLAQEGFSQTIPLAATIRKKASVTTHLPKGADAHRRQKAA